MGTIGVGNLPLSPVINSLKRTVDPRRKKIRPDVQRLFDQYALVASCEEFNAFYSIDTGRAQSNKEHISCSIQELEAYGCAVISHTQVGECRYS